MWLEKFVVMERSSSKLVVKVLLRPIARGPFKLAQMKLKGKY
jgi:hypothetical protein